MENKRVEISITELNVLLKKTTQGGQELLHGGKVLGPTSVLNALKDKVCLSIYLPPPEGQGNGRLVLQDLRVTDVCHVDDTLDLDDVVKDWILLLGCSLEIKNCEFIRAGIFVNPTQLFFNISHFNQIKFIRNDFSSLITTLYVSDEFKGLVEKVTISDNTCYSLAIRYSRGDKRDEIPLYWGSVFENNEIYHVLLLDISKKSAGRLNFSFGNNKIDTLAFSYPQEQSPLEFFKGPPNISPFLLRDTLRDQALHIDHPASYRLIMASANNIEEIFMAGRYPKIVRWGLNQNIGDAILESYNHPEHNVATAREELGKAIAKERIERNRYIFRFLKEVAIKEGNRVPEQVMNYNITKMDGMLLKMDNWSWQDRLISWAGWELSRHGTSWIRPIAWILGSVLFFAAIITWALGDGGSVIGSFLVDMATTLPEKVPLGFAFFLASILTLAIVVGTFGISMFLLYRSFGSGILWVRIYGVLHFSSAAIIMILWISGRELIEVSPDLKSIIILLLGMWCAGIAVYAASNIINLRKDWSDGTMLFLLVFVIVGLLGTAVGDEGILYRAVLLELMNPLGNPQQILDNPLVSGGLVPGYSFPIFTALFFSYKAFYAICIFMFYRAATRFTIK